MSDDDLRARFEQALVEDEALRDAVLHSPSGFDVSRLIWSHGYCDGKQDGLAQAQEIVGRKH